MGNRSFRWLTSITLMAVVYALDAPAAGQRAPFATPPPGSGSTPMRPFGRFADCPEQPAQFHPCALAKAKTFNPPRTADGKPDLQGIWGRIGIRNMENIEEHPETMDGSGGTTAVVDPADGRVPYQPWAAAKRDTHFSTYLNPAQLCLPQGSPKQAYGPGGFRILQAPGFVAMLNDYAHTYRVIYTDGRPHLGPDMRLHEGDPRGRWEGNTLVVDVTNQRARTWLDHVGNFFSDAVHVVERITMIDKDVIHYQATIEDPNVYTRPWTMALGWRRSTAKDLEMWESACYEGISKGGLPLDWLKQGLKPYPEVTFP